MSTPVDVFLRAKAAVAAGDWESFFPLVHTRDLLTVAANGANWLATDNEPAAVAARVEMRQRYGLHLDEASRLAAQVADSAARLMSASRSQEVAERVDASRRHKGIVDELEASIRSSLEAVADLPGLTAALEHTLRAARGGGSVASRMFQDEEVGEVVVTGGRATATLRRSDGTTRPLRLTQTPAGWRIHLF